MWERGRANPSKGEDHGMSVLSDEQVKLIKLLEIENKVSSYRAAKQYNVHSSVICHIWSCRIWMHVEPQLNELLLQRRPVTTRKIAETQVIQIRTLYNEGLGPAQIAEEVGLLKNVVISIIYDGNYKGIGPEIIARNSIAPHRSRDDEIAALMDQGLRQYQIADRLGIYPSIVMDARRRILDHREQQQLATSRRKIEWRVRLPRIGL
jgi:hypothetical protein